MSRSIAVFGLGEAGGVVAADLATRADVHAFDPAGRATPPGVHRHADPRRCVASADVVLAMTSTSDAETALRQALDAIPTTAVYADLSTSSPDLKRGLATIATDRDLLFADVALMGSVPGRGIRTPQLASGPGATVYAATLGPLGADTTVVSAEVGDAATRKLLRSILTKGLTAVLIEAIQAGQAAGLGEWLWDHLVAELTATDEALLERLLRSTIVHAERRHDELVGVTGLLEELGVEPVMTTATLTRLRRVIDDGLPGLDGQLRSET